MIDAAHPRDPAFPGVASEVVELDTFEGDTRVRAEPFEAIELDLGRIWRW